jgi:hypothetical protein
MGLIQTPGFKSAFIDDLTVSILYEGLLVEQKVRKEYSSALFETVASKLGINAASLTSNVLQHICSAYLLSFKELDAAFVSESSRMRYVMKCMPRNIAYFYQKSLGETVTQLPTFLAGKKIVVLSDHADLIKVQFVRMKTTEEGRGLFNYSLMSLDPASIIEYTDRSLYFESLDALRMKILNLAFDGIIIHSDIYSLPLSSFINRLSLPCFILDDSIYGMYNIAKKHAQITDENKHPGVLFLEDYDKEENEDFTATVYLSKKPVKRIK